MRDQDHCRLSVAVQDAFALRDLLNLYFHLLINFFVFQLLCLSNNYKGLKLLDLYPLTRKANLINLNNKSK